jgi:short-subunit dehydrogenase
MNGKSSFFQQYVVITGASSGIGKELAIQLSQQGARLILLARRTDLLEEIKQSCLKHTDFCTAISLDLAEDTSIRQAANAVINSCPQIDVLFNNAGISQRSKAIDTLFETEKRIMQVNYFGPVLFSKLLFPHLNKTHSGIVITSSVVGLFAFPSRSTYAASKHALHGYFNTLALEENDWLRILIVCPGRINTPISLSAVGADGSAHGQMDPGQANGIAVAECVKKMLSAYQKNKKLVLIARGERLLYWLSKYIPSLYRFISQKISPV